MRTVVAAVIERTDRRLLIGKRKRDDTSPLKWEFPGGKVELGARMQPSVPIGRTVHKYAATPEDLEILFYAVEIGEPEIIPRAFEQIAWVLPKELGAYDFLPANAQLVAQLATGRIKPREILENSA